MICQESIKQGKIMIVDDEHANVLLLEKMLQQEGYSSIHSVEDSRKAEALYEAVEPDILLLDLNMPHLDGFQIMEKVIQSNGSSPPVLVLTAQKDDEIRVKALRAGAIDFLSKPFSYVEVLTRIKNIMTVRLLYKQALQQNEILDRKVSERTYELEVSRMEALQRLSKAAEYRDNETGMHVLRMSLYSEILARAAGLSDKECKLIQHASPMHDVGKIGIPDGILLKPGKLTEEEWEIMKTHAEIGGQILSSGTSEIMLKAETIALTHHEQWAGGGYPKGLKGEEIPIEGRIVILADVFDALCSKRPYKESWSIEDTVTEMENNSGIMFDPELVKIFKTSLPEFLKIMEGFSDC
ncbi:MAG: response regulator [Candidatus Nitrohelix vancouverensis]|uniref:Response regulator n=1 Tax=Candidatus Nitrohelix vancouverensis TaxID=2705534 RepID=A0A7T0C1H5_9BACT|nr:MAG: response regulator [Candidatus Nitrohelix vancouverensis]